MSRLWTGREEPREFISSCCCWRMPSASTKPDTKASPEASDPLKQVLLVVEKKVRNLEKRKVGTILFPKVWNFQKHRLNDDHPTGSRWITLSDPRTFCAVLEKCLCHHVAINIPYSYVTFKKKHKCLLVQSENPGFAWQFTLSRNSVLQSWDLFYFDQGTKTIKSFLFMLLLSPAFVAAMP